jgi:chitosanase
MRALFLVLLVGCSTGHSTDGETAQDLENERKAAPLPVVDPLTRQKATMLTSIWENGTTVLQYGYCENIHDGRGYTSGRAGFCSGTGDAMLVVQCMGTAGKMAKYAAALSKLNDKFESTGHDQASTTTLDALGNYCADWAADARTAPFVACEDKVVDDLYMKPAIVEMSKHGLTSALSFAALYDAEINHGDEGKDGVQDLAEKATTKAGAGAMEPTWLEAFLTVRLALLKSDATWADAVDRVANYEAQLRANNLTLAQPVTTSAKAKTMFPGQGFKDSGYPKCTIAPDATVTGDHDCTNPHPRN